MVLLQSYGPPCVEYWPWGPLCLVPDIPPSQERWLEGKSHPTADQNTKGASGKLPALSAQSALSGSRVQ